MSCIIINRESNYVTKYVKWRESPWFFIVSSSFLQHVIPNNFYIYAVFNLDFLINIDGCFVLEGCINNSPNACTN